MGKTSIRRKYFGDHFVKDHLSTLGADFAVKRIDVSAETTLEVQIWDLAGQKGFHNLRQRFFRGASVALLIFDLTDSETLYKLKDWLKQIWDVIEQKDIPLAFIGNKRDLPDIVITEDIVRNFITEIRQENKLSDDTWIEYFETSAKTGENVLECFTAIGNAFIAKVEK